MAFLFQFMNFYVINRYFQSRKLEMAMKIFICSFQCRIKKIIFLMRFLFVTQLQPFTMWISNTYSEGCEEDNGFKKENENKFMAALNFLFQNFKCWITFKYSFFTLRNEDAIHIKPSEFFSFTELKQLLSKSYSCIRCWTQSLTSIWRAK